MEKVQNISGTTKVTIEENKNRKLAIELNLCPSIIWGANASRVRLVNSNRIKAIMDNPDKM